MKQRLKSVAVGLSVLVVLAGCGGSAPTPGSSAPITGSSNPDATAASASAGATSTAPQSSGGAPATGAANLPSNLPPIFSSHADPALESQLPSEASGTPMARYSISFAELLADSTDRASIDAFLQGMGKTEADGSFAVALDPSNTLGGGIFAFKVNGADAATLLAGIVAVERSDMGADVTTQEATVGGKDVTVLSVGGGVNDTEWIYGRGDIVFVVHAPDEAHAAAFLQAIQ